MVSVQLAAVESLVRLEATEAAALLTMAAAAEADMAAAVQVTISAQLLFGVVVGLGVVRTSGLEPLV